MFCFMYLVLKTHILYHLIDLDFESSVHLISYFKSLQIEFFLNMRIIYIIYLLKIDTKRKSVFLINWRVENLNIGLALQIYEITLPS